MILTFRANVPNATPAKTPVSVILTSQARAIQEVVLFSNTTTLAINKAGFRMYDRSRLIVPEAGSWGQENFAAADETNWAAIPSAPVSLDMNEWRLPGPPYTIRLDFYNIDAAAILVAGYVVVREPFAEISADDALAGFSVRSPLAEKQAGASDLPLGKPQSIADMTSKARG